MKLFMNSLWNVFVVIRCSLVKVVGDCRWISVWVLQETFRPCLWLRQQAATRGTAFALNL